MHRILQRSRSEPPCVGDDSQTVWSSSADSAVDSKCSPPTASSRLPFPTLLQVSTPSNSDMADKVPIGRLQFPLPGSNWIDRSKVRLEPIKTTAKEVASATVRVAQNPQTQVGNEASIDTARQMGEKSSAIPSTPDAACAKLANDIAQVVASAAKTAAYELLTNRSKSKGDNMEDVHRHVHDAHSRSCLKHTETHLSLATSVASVASQRQDPSTILHGLEEAVCTGLVDSFFEGMRSQRQQVSYDIHLPRGAAPSSMAAFARRGKSTSGISSGPPPSLTGASVRSGNSDQERNHKLRNEPSQVVTLSTHSPPLKIPWASEASDCTSDLSSQASVQTLERGRATGFKELASKKSNLDSFEVSREQQVGGVLARIGGKLVSSIARCLPNTRGRNNYLKHPCSKIWPPADSSMTLQGLRSESDCRLSRMAVSKNGPIEKPQFNCSAASLEPGAHHLLHLHGYWVTFWLQLWGVVPACSCSIPLNQILCIIMALCIAIANASQIWSLSVEKHWQAALGDFLLSLCALGCLLSCRSLHRCKLLNRRKAVLLQYAEHRGFLLHWRAQLQRSAIISGIAWCVIVLSRTVLELLSSESVPLMGIENSKSLSMATIRCIRTLIFAFMTGVIIATVFCVLSYLIGLLLAIGAFCVQCTEQAINYDILKADWNILQALLRQASLMMSPSIVWLVLCAAIIFFSSAASLLFERPELTRYLPVSVPAFLLILWIYRMLWMAASVTSTCLRMPPFINSLGMSGNKWEKQSLIEYVKNSAAGFYVQESILTTEVVLKMLYVSIVVMFTILTKMSTEEVAF